MTGTPCPGRLLRYDGIAGDRPFLGRVAAKRPPVPGGSVDGGVDVVPRTPGVLLPFSFLVVVRLTLVLLVRVAVLVVRPGAPCLVAEDGQLAHEAQGRHPREKVHSQSARLLAVPGHRHRPTPGKLLAVLSVIADHGAAGRRGLTAVQPTVPFSKSDVSGVCRRALLGLRTLFFSCLYSSMGDFRLSWLCSGLGA